MNTGGPIDVDRFALQHGPADNQGSDAAFPTVMGQGGAFKPADKLEQG